MDIALVLPTIREKHAREFLETWDFNAQDIRVYVIEDNPNCTFDLDMPGDIVHYSWRDIRNRLGDKEWIIPRRTAAIRSFGYLEAYRDGAEIILTLDDDCLPVPLSGAASFAAEHKAMLGAVFSRWVDTISTPSLSARGTPYRNRGETPTAINMGGWCNNPDIDAVTTLAIWGDGFRYRMASWNPVPKGMYFSLCAMNVGFRRDATVLMYQLLMSQDRKGKNWPFTRYDDIWGGVIAKKLCDELGWAITAGTPEIWHSKASNVWTNLKLETTGMAVNEGFWKVIDEISIYANGPVSAYAQIAHAMGKELKKAYPDYAAYWETLCTAMNIWAEEIDSCG